jgi:ABC-type dipeptide/oligopeptide/nickel transport system permease component
LLPGDVARIILGREAGEPAIQALRKQLGLNLPVPVQYARWLGHFVTGNWGTSFASQADVFPLVMQRLRNSLMPLAVTLVIAIPVAVTLGVVAGLRENSWVDNVRAGVIEELKKAYVRTATLKGLPYRTVIFKHVLRNALLPTITVIAISFGWLISGLVVTENVFNYPGLGHLLVFSINRRDLPVIQAVAMVTVIAFALANLVADLLYSYLNPRIRLGE